MKGAPIAALALSTLVLASLVGCAPAEAGLPDRVEVSVHQNRSDTEHRLLQVRVANGSDEPLIVTDLEFSGPSFAEPAHYPKAPSTVRAGTMLDLPIALPEVVCDEKPGAAEVRLGFERPDGSTGAATVVPADPLDQLAGIAARECLDDAIAAVAEIREPEHIRVEQQSGRSVAYVDLSIEPTGASGSFTIHSVDDTVLFGVFDPASAVPAATLPIEQTVDAGDEATVLSIALVPARCDAHAVAEDKRGTLLPLRVDVGELTGIRYFALSDDLKGELYAYLGEACEGR